MTGSERMERVAQNPWFAVIGRGAMILVIPILGYVANSLVELKTNLKVLDVKFETQRLLAEGQAVDRYRATDAVRDLRLLQIQIDHVNRRLDQLERRP